MSATSAIEWTEKTWNPVRGCSVISPGCVNCYAMKQAHRFSGLRRTANGSHVRGPYFDLTKQTKAGPQWTGQIRLVEDALLEPLSWRKPQRVFVNSMSDLFHEDVPFEFVDKVWDVMWATPRHTYQILTKRPERMVEYVRKRAVYRRFGWTDQGRPAMRHGEFIHLEDIRMRNMCGYVGQAEWACDHPAHGGKEDSCGEYDCPIALRVDEREKLRKIGVEDDYTYGPDGYAEDSQWMELTSRPLHAAAGNVWLGFSAEDQKRFEERMRVFRPLRWILGPHFTLFASLEPLLSSIEFTIPYYEDGDEHNRSPWNALSRHDFRDGSGPCDRPYLDWVIVGGESGPGARPMDLAWTRSIVAQCKAAGVACFVKQLGSQPRGVCSWPHHDECPPIWLDDDGVIPSVSKRAATDLCHAVDDCWFPCKPKLADRKGGDPEEWPTDLRVREYPHTI